jgi:hypothetical protein
MVALCPLGPDGSPRPCLPAICATWRRPCQILCPFKDYPDSGALILPASPTSPPARPAAFFNFSSLPPPLTPFTFQLGIPARGPTPSPGNAKHVVVSRYSRRYSICFSPRHLSFDEPVTSSAFLPLFLAGARVRRPRGLSSAPQGFSRPAATSEAFNRRPLIGDWALKGRGGG